MSNRIVVYTCITGNYDALRPISKKSSGVDYICFTDNPSFRSNDWRIIPIPSDLRSLSPIKQQRLIKILPNKYLSQYDISIWFDANIQIKCNLIADFLSEIPISSNFIFVKPHPVRNCAYEEAKAVIRLGKDDAEVVSKQMANYYNEGYPTGNGLVESNILIRKHNDINCIRLMYTWATEVVKGSFRDQLSFNYACWKNGIEYGIIPATSNKNTADRFRIFSHGQAIEENIGESEEIEHEDDEHPPITIVITTHNRTNVACATIDSLIKNLHYENIRWCITDDRSENGHIDTLIDRFRSYNINNVIVCKTNFLHYGLGSALNNGLKAAFSISDIVLTTEDDWILEKPLDITRYVSIIKNDDTIAGIRLGAAMFKRNNVMKVASKYEGLSKIRATDVNKFAWIFNNQVMIRHKRVYDAIGFYLNSVSPDESEIDMSKKYSAYTNNGISNDLITLIPKHFVEESLDDRSLFFIHAGKSTQGHTHFNVPSRYANLYQDKHFFHIIIPHYNTDTELTKRALDSIANQTFSDFHVTIVDDASDYLIRKQLKNLCKNYSFAKTIFLDNHADGGGCRNIAMNDYNNSSYTLFLDSDDYYTSDDVLSNLHSLILDKKCDAVLCSYTERKNKIDTFKQLVYKNKFQLALYVQAPWTLCVKTPLLRQFKENRKRFNDVVWYMRMCDVISSICATKFSVVTYTIDENTHSCQHAKLNNNRISSLYYLIADLIEENFCTKDLSKAKRELLSMKFDVLADNHFYKDMII